MTTTTTIETSVAYISLLENGIIRIKTKDDIFMEPHHLDENYQAYRQLIPEGKICFLVVLGKGNSVSKEGRKKMASVESSVYKKATVFVSRSLAYRLLVNVHIRATRNTHPVKIFQNEEAATEWLLTQMEK